MDSFITEGDCVVIRGASGAGKTTLLKTLCGQYIPTSGSLKLNGIPIIASNRRYLKSHIAAIMQNDHLFNGTVFENITFFDSTPDFDFVHECAEVACVHAEIITFPMAYNTFIGEMGTALSQGQQQRVLIARAIYLKRKVLILDEATAHIDIETEQKILHNLRDRGLTMILTAHRPSILKFATKIWNLN